MHKILITLLVLLFFGNGLAFAKSPTPCDETCENARISIIALAQKFKENEDYYTSKKFNESDLRVEFVDKFFEILGWDVTNREKLFLYLQDTIPETRLRIGKVMRYADYGMRINGRAVFYVEAEAANRPLYKAKNVHQAKRYAWSSTHAELAVLTNFKGLCIYDARLKPNIEEVETGKLNNYCMEYTEYAQAWPELWALLEKDNVANGSIDKLLEETDTSFEREPVDKAFLSDLDRYRLELAKDIYQANSEITEKNLNEATHHILNQIVFARVLEDRDIEPTGRLREAVRMWQERKRSDKLLHEYLKSEFRRLEKRYNGVIFSPHFSDNLIVPDKALAAIIQSLYPPVSPYAFDVIPVEVLGRAYEQYLGKNIELQNNKVTLALKPEVRKAGGVFYTPEFVVDYILDRTLGEKLYQRSAGELDKIKILDLACGAGAFSVAAAKNVLDKARSYYANNPDKINGVETEFPDAYKIDDGSYKLSVKRKIDLISNSIYCTDVDPQAIQITRMWLYILMLQGEGSAILRHERKYKVPNRHWPQSVKGFKLPDLEQNIINANALVETDFSKNEEENSRVRAFDWKPDNSKIGKIIQNGGFDVIVGNPPYISLLDTKAYIPKQQEYIKKKYKSMSYGRPDLSFAFLERGIELLKDDGYLGYITSNSFIWNEAGIPLRQIISEGNYMHSLLDLGVTRIFKDAGPSTAIVVLNKNDNQHFVHGRVNDPKNKLARKLQTSMPEMDIQTLPSEQLKRVNWAFPAVENLELFKAMDNSSTRFGDHVNAFTGLITGADKVFMVEIIENQNDKALIKSKQTGKTHLIEADLLKPVLLARNVYRYQEPENKKWLIYPYEAESKLMDETILSEKYPLAYEYFKINEEVLTARSFLDDRSWYAFSRGRDYRLTSPKLITGWRLGKQSFTYDINAKYFFGGSGRYCGVVLRSDEYNLLELLGILNSDPIYQFVKATRQNLWGGYQYSARLIEQLPIPEKNEKNVHLFKEISLQVRYILMLNGVYEAEHDKDKTLSDANKLSIQKRLEGRIDDLVNRLYLGRY